MGISKGILLLDRISKRGFQCFGWNVRISVIVNPYLEKNKAGFQLFFSRNCQYFQMEKVEILFLDWKMNGGIQNFYMESNIIMEILRGDCMGNFDVYGDKFLSSDQ